GGRGGVGPSGLRPRVVPGGRGAGGVALLAGSRGRLPRSRFRARGKGAVGRSRAHSRARAPVVRRRGRRFAPQPPSSPGAVVNLLRLSCASGFALSILVLLGVSGRPAAAVELRTGDVLVADFLVPGIVHVTTSTGEQVVLPDPDDVLDGPTGVALAAHPGA